jgi:hypothetical protein
VPFVPWSHLSYIAFVSQNLSLVSTPATSPLVHLQGRSREEAHRIGAEIAAAVTAANPTPVTLKMEKVRWHQTWHTCWCTTTHQGPRVC